MLRVTGLSLCNSSQSTETTGQTQNKWQDLLLHSFF
uniref:Uncharacterized protein n=1 Tax=Anguilla anguilla TaxID=7936 RepID=A0A0E9UTF7_ANGAN